MYRFVTWVVVAATLAALAAADYRKISMIPGLTSSYKVYTERVNWVNATLKCLSDDAHLAVINSIEESQGIVLLANAYADQSVPYETFHVGIQVVPLTRIWTTVQGTSLSAAGYDLWSPNTPNNRGGHENCGCVYRSARYEDIPCDTYLSGFICEKDEHEPCFNPEE